MPVTDMNFLNWLWGVLSVPLLWMWSRINRAEARANETRITLAERHYTKLEVENLVEKSVGPINSKLNDINESVKYLVRREYASEHNERERNK